MKPIYLAALLAFGTVSCVDNIPKLQLLSATPPDEDCTVPEDEALLSGSLNMALSSNYNLGFVVTSNLTSTPIVVGEGQVADPDSNAIYLTELDLSYRTEPELNIPSATLPVYAAFRANEDSTLLMSVLTRDAQNALFSATTGGGIVDVLVTMRIRGHTITGGSVETNELSYAITVTTVPYICPKPGEFPAAPTVLCDQRGQNGAVPLCEAP
ncbi:hypothetical protein [Myxococcus eversor]|uniref:hypothetical protein n=1 Tax=Myxococcus eversor TaxID=2709661 RepID=UPI0013D3CE98|nr:hypothetical protein [Myxococcus eversor]